MVLMTVLEMASVSSRYILQTRIVTDWIADDVMELMVAPRPGIGFPDSFRLRRVSVWSEVLCDRLYPVFDVRS